MAPLFPSPTQGFSITHPLNGVVTVWQEAMLQRLPETTARLIRLQQGWDRATWETTRKSVRSNLDGLAETTSEAGVVSSGLFLQERLRLQLKLQELDALEPLILEREAIQAGQPPGCACLGVGGLAPLIYVLSDGTAVFEQYCRCPDGEAAREAALWANEAAQAQEIEDRRQDAELQRQARAREIRERAGIDQRYAICTFASFRTLLRRRKLLTPQIERFLATCEAAYGDGEPLRGDYLYGAPGHGKTSVAISCLRAWVERGRSGLFVRCGDLVDTIRASWRRRDGEADLLLERLRTVPLLVLDDFAMHDGTSGEQAIFVKLLSARHAAGRERLTIVTSNYPPGEAAQRLAANESPYEAERIAGRLLEMCDPWELITGKLRTGDRRDIPS
jgi:DNA replication protein DnaC